MTIYKTTTKIPKDTLRHLKVSYFFYYNNSKSLTTRLLLSPSKALKVLLGTSKGLLVSCAGLSRISHVVVCLELDDVQVYVHSMYSDNTVWSSEPPTRQPDLVLSEYGEMETGLLDLTIPSGEHYSLLRTVLYYLVGYPRHTINCVTVVHRIRYLLGRTTRRRTPGGLYRELRKQEQVFHQ